MNTATKVNIRTMLADALSHLGIRSVLQIEEHIRQALDYLSRDREHYVEAVEPDFPEHKITERFGVICKLIPVAREITRRQEKNRVWERTDILFLMVTEESVRYVCSDSYAWLYENPKKNTYSFPAHRYTELEDIRKNLRPCPPDEIRPAATRQEWEVYAMMFAAFDKFHTDQPLNSIPRKAERSMLTYARTTPETLTVGGRKVTGKLIPLADGFPREEQRPDHRYTRTDELCLLVTENSQRYLLKSRHTYRYFRKDIFDDVPGGCGYEPTDKKTEITYSFTRLEDIRQIMFSHYR